MLQTTLVFWYWQGAMPVAHDTVAIDEGGNMRGRYSGETLEQLRINRADMQTCEFDEFVKIKETAIRTAPMPCTEEQFFDALGCMPPLDHEFVDGIESFKLAERFSGRMTNIYARTESGCWSFMDRDDLNADSIADLINAAGQGSNENV